MIIATYSVNFLIMNIISEMYLYETGKMRGGAGVAPPGHFDNL